MKKYIILLLMLFPVTAIAETSGIGLTLPGASASYGQDSIRAGDLDESKALEAKKRAEEAMSSSQTEQDISTTQAALAESMMQLQMISKMRGKKR